MAVYATCTYHLYRSKKFPWMQQIYITVLFILAAVTIACNINFNELAWIDERNYPGGRYLVNGPKASMLTLARQALWHLLTSKKPYLLTRSETLPVS